MPQFPPLTALVVEPDPLLRERLRRMLRRLGVAQVIFAASGADASTILAGELIDLVLTRWELHDLRGLQLLDALRGRGRNGAVPVILLDDGQPAESLVAAVKWGIVGRLPFPPQQPALEALLRTIGEDLARRAARHS